MSWIIRETPKFQRRSKVLKEVFNRLLGGTESFHSGAGSTLRLEIERLEEQQIPYQLTAFPGRAYIVKRIGSFEEYLDESRESEKMK